MFLTFIVLEKGLEPLYSGAAGWTVTVEIMV
jgi:hypothetical protein